MLLALHQPFATRVWSLFPSTHLLLDGKQEAGHLACLGHVSGFMLLKASTACHITHQCAELTKVWSLGYLKKARPFRLTQAW